MPVPEFMTFSLITSTLYYQLPTLQTAVSLTASSIVQCGFACKSSPDCGGFTWNPDQTPMCVLISQQQGANGTVNTNIYSMTTMRGKKLIKLPHHDLDISYTQCVSICANAGGTMLPPPANIQEWTLYTMRTRSSLFIGMETEAGVGTDVFGVQYSVDDPIFTGYWKSGQPRATKSIVMIKDYELKNVYDNFLRSVDIICLEN